MKQIFVAALTSLLALPVAADPLHRLPYTTPVRSLEDARMQIAWTGAACIMGDADYQLFDGSTHSLASVAVETGVSLRQITEWAAMRGAEHDIAVTVLRAGGEPLRDPPQPFLDHLRTTQATCQDFARSRAVLARMIAQGTAPTVTPPAAANTRRTACAARPVARCKMLCGTPPACPETPDTR